MNGEYWLIELRNPGPAMYYTAPSHWGSNVDLATKFHTQEAASAEARSLPKSLNPETAIIVCEHLWSHE